MGPRKAHTQENLPLIRESPILVHSHKHLSDHRLYTVVNTAWAQWQMSYLWDVIAWDKFITWCEQCRLIDHL